MPDSSDPSAAAVPDSLTDSPASDSPASELPAAQEPLRPAVRPMAYHRRLLDYLKTHEVDLWTWFSSHQARQENAAAVRLELLKTACRLDPESASELYQQANAVRHMMGMTASLTLYQAQHATGLNASLAWLPGEAHVVLHGPVQETLTPEEMSALIAHELAHHELYSIDAGAYLILEQILSAMVGDQAAESPHEKTWRSHRLYTELHCDRRAAEVTDQMEACVRALVKLETGLKSVSAEAYLQQAAEALASGACGSEGITHPEMFIRARALQLWQEDPDTVDDRLPELIEGPLQLKQLDLLRQQQMVSLTRDLLTDYLSRSWLRTDLMLGHAKRFFEDFSVTELNSERSNHAVDRSALRDRILQCDSELRNYVCFVLLDFVTCDPDLDEGPLAAAFLLADHLELTDAFRELAASELKLGRRALQKVETDAAAIVQRAAQELT